MAANEGYACDGCRAECAEAEVDPPCEREGGIDPETGLCPLGMPEVMGENRLAIEVYGDMMALGWEVARDLHELSLDPRARGDLLTKLRVLTDEAYTIRKEKAEEAERKAGTHAGNPTHR